MFSTAKKATARLRGFHHLVLGQPPVNVNFRPGAAWLMADGWNALLASVPNSAAEWRRKASGLLRDLADSLRAQCSPRPVTIVVLGEGIEAPKLRGAFSAIAERLENCKLLVANNGNQDNADRILLEEEAALTVVECRYRDLALGVAQMLGDLPTESRVRLPAKANDEGLTNVDVPSEQATLFEETIDLVHDGLVASDIVSRSSGPSFSEGAIISWHDLNRNLDVSRDLTIDIRGPLTNLLEDNRVVALRLKHKPGAGGTTIARRLAWEYRNLYPTCLVKLYNHSTADHLETVYQLTGLSLFIIAERANLLPGLRDHLIDDLRGRRIRFVFLDVIRSTALQSENLSFLLDDQMIDREARRFFELYGRWCNEERREALHQLTFDDQFREFRSPFFYTLYAFERDFSNVPDYVRSYREGLSDDQGILLDSLR